MGPLDRYLREQATQDVRRRASACFVAVEADGCRIAGYDTLAAGVPLTDLPGSLAKRLPRDPSVPVARLGRLAVARAFRGRKLGSALLWDAGLRASRSDVAGARQRSQESFCRQFRRVASVQKVG